MKKVFATVLGLALCGAVVFGATACGNEEEDGNETTSKTYSVYAPDGAPALALCNAIANSANATADSGVSLLSAALPPSYQFEYHVVDSTLINTYVTGENPAADFCILPVNAASKFLGTGATYQMLGTVTNGNIYFLTAGENETLTSDNLSAALVGKTVGVVQLTNVPGLTLQVVLNNYGIDYQIVESMQAEQAEDKVNLLAVEATDVTPAYGCDYYLCPEPAATTKINGTASSAKPFRMAGDLQELYGEDEGYPQAVLVAKTTVESAAIAEMIAYMQDSKDYLASVSSETVLELLEDKRTAGLSPFFNANNLNAAVIANCSVWFTSAQNCKAKVNEYLAKVIEVNGTAASAVSDSFYYAG